jgi:hypothetical protein
MQGLSKFQAWYEQHPHHAQRVLLVTLDTLGALALATLAPHAAWEIMKDFAAEVVTQPTYGIMALACVAYAFAMAAARRWQSAIYERLLYAVVIGGVMIVGVCTWWRVASFPVPEGEARAIAQWALRVVAYHFTVAAFPIIIWQFGQEQYELHEAEALRVRAK